MKNAGILAVNVIKDTARRKLFYVVFIFGLAMLALSPLLPSFELGTKADFLKDVSLSLTSLFGVALAVILSVNQVPGEIEKRTIYNILSKPVSRLQYLFGKYLGTLASLAIILFLMGVEIFVLVFWRMRVLSPAVFQGVFAVFLECAVIAAFCFCLSTFLSVPVNVFATILFYVITHVKTGFLHEKLVGDAAGFVKVISWPFYYLIPNLENFNVSQQIGYGGGVTGVDMLRITGYAALFAALFFIIGYIVFRRKNL